jgi:sensor histidine kinase YesM
MKTTQPIGKQFRVAVYTSPAISALTVTPMFILGAIRFELFPWAFGISTLLVFLFWSANIGIYLLFARNAGGSGWMRYLSSYAFCILFSFFLFHDLFFRFHWHFGSSSSGIHFHLILFFAIDTVILILQDLVVTREKNARIQLENSRLRMRDMEAMNLRLTQQVHPHFLFNSLNTLKALIGVSPERASEYLLRLSGFLRSSMTGHAFSTVKVGKELGLCIDYLEMQRIRFGTALQFSIDVPQEVQESGFLPVFSLQLLIENAIKHNELTPERPLLIGIVYRNGLIAVHNNLQRKGTAVAEGNGSGLLNLQERYTVLSGDSVVIEEAADLFSVSIKVLLHERGDH